MSETHVPMIPSCRTTIDAHCHIASTDHVPRAFTEGTVQGIVESLAARGISTPAERVWNMYLEKMQDPWCDTLVREMDECGIAKSILLVPDFTYAMKGCALSIEESFERHSAVLARHPGRFEVFGGVDPRWGTSGVDLFERSLLEFGFRGLKLYPPCGFSPGDSMLFPLYELCAHYNVPVLLHIGPTSPGLRFDTSNPFQLDAAARSFPSVNFILAHGSVSFTEECIMMCRFRPNVYLDISAFQLALSSTRAIDKMRLTFAAGINHKVIFGTDWPVFRLQGNQKHFVDAVTADDGLLDEVMETERELILHGNIERLLSRASVCSEAAGVRSGVV